MNENNASTELAPAQANARPRGQRQAARGLDFNQLLLICAHYWYWFAISVVVCVGLAWINYKRTAPIYQREAMIQIVHPDGSTQGNQGSSVFQALGMTGAYPEKMAEKIIITSPSVMAEVVKRLSLNMSYIVPGGWHPTTLYGTTQPFTVSFPGMDDETVCQLETEVLPDGMLHIKSITGTDNEGRSYNMPAVDVKLDYAAGKTIKTPMGEMVFMANPMYRGPVIEDPLPVTVTKSSAYRAAMALTGSVETEIPEEFAEIITLKKADIDPQRASDILNAVIAVYNEQWADERAKVAAATSEFINDRLNRIAVELEDVESDIAGYKSSHLVGVDASSFSSNYFDQASRANEQVMELNNCLVMASYVRDFINNASNFNEVLPSNAGVGSVNIESQITRYNELLMERNRLVANSSPSNPIVLDYDQQLNGLRSALLKSLDNAIALYRQQIQSARQSESAATAKIASSPTQAQHLLSVERKQKVIESLYLFLMQKREENELSQQYNSQRMRIIAAPNGSPGPIAPVRNNALLIALGIGLFIPFGIIYVSEAFNNKVRSRRDLESLKVPYLGELPDVAPKMTRLRRLLPGGRRTMPNQVLVEQSNVNIINEAFRMLRTNLELMTRRTPGSDAIVMGITSLNPGSGKTFISMNLAAALAIKGHRVLVIDMDLRRASLSESLKLSHRSRNRHVGLVDWLVNNGNFSSPDELVVKGLNGLDNLDVVSCGLIPPNPSELLAEESVGRLVDYYKKQYDYVIFDCPPVEMMADTLIINKYVDMTCFVIRAGLFHTDLIDNVQEMYDTQRYRSMAIILNATKSRPGYGYHYYYGYGYGYGYGHGYYGKKRSKSSTAETANV